MSANNVFGRVLAGCIFTLLVPVSASLSDEGAIAPRLDPCSVERDPLGDLMFGAARELFPGPIAASTGSSLDSIDSAAPWFRGSFDPFPVGWMCRVEPTIEAPALAEQVPGAVKNFRRSDQR